MGLCDRGGRLCNGGGGRGGTEEPSGKLWHDSSPNLEGRSNAGDWQICRDKASCQSAASVAHHRYQPPPPFIPEGPCRQDGGDPKYHSSSTLDKPNICFAKSHGYLYSVLSFLLFQSDWFFSTKRWNYWDISFCFRFLTSADRAEIDRKCPRTSDFLI